MFRRQHGLMSMLPPPCSPFRLAEAERPIAQRVSHLSSKSWPADVPASQIVISVSPDGTGFVAPSPARPTRLWFRLRCREAATPYRRDTRRCSSAEPATRRLATVRSAIPYWWPIPATINCMPMSPTTCCGRQRQRFVRRQFCEHCGRWRRCGDGFCREWRHAGDPRHRPADVRRWGGTATVTGGAGPETITAGPGGRVPRSWLRPCHRQQRNRIGDHVWCFR